MRAFAERWMPVAEAVDRARKTLARTLWDDISDAVDKWYTPWEGVKTPRALEEVEYLLVANQPGLPGDKVDVMVRRGYTTKEEVWLIYTYLLQVRRELMGRHGLKPSHWAGLILPVEEAARRSR